MVGTGSGNLCILHSLFCNPYFSVYKPMCASQLGTNNKFNISRK